MKKTIEYSYEEHGPTPETASKLRKDWWAELVSAGTITPEQRDIGDEIRSGYGYITRPVDWNLGDLEKVGKSGGGDEGSEPPHVLRYYAWCKTMRQHKLPLRDVLDFIVDGSTCISGRFGRACELYVEANGWRWRW